MSETKDEVEWGWWSKGPYHFALQKMPGNRWVFPSLGGVILRTDDEMRNNFIYGGVAYPATPSVVPTEGQEARKLRL